MAQKRNATERRGVQRTKYAGLSRRQFIQRAACAGLAMAGLGAAASGCAASADRSPQARSPPAQRPGAGGVNAGVGDRPSGEAKVEIRNVGKFRFEASEVRTVRPDLFQAGHFSLFDVLVHLDAQGDIDLAYHFDEAMDTHVIDAIDGVSGWWYQAYYSGGWPESSIWRMDMYPYKDETHLEIFPRDEERVEAIYRTYRSEVTRLARNGGQLLLPDLLVRSPKFGASYENVRVTAHDTRLDLLQPGVITALDALLSLKDQGALEYVDLAWYERIGPANPVDSYWVTRIEEAEAYGGCGFVYEVGPRDYEGFGGIHIHIPSDARITVSPEYALWFWICL